MAGKVQEMGGVLRQTKRQLGFSLEHQVRADVPGCTQSITTTEKEHHMTEQDILELIRLLRQ